MKAGSLFTGTGALDLAAAEVFGAELAWVADLDPGATALLAHHYPGVPNHGDISATDWYQVEPVDLVTAGWPCQPFSLAGKRKGAEDERALWPDVARAIRILRPRYAALENVRAVVTAGELGRVADSLADLGYRVAWVCLPASAVGAPHKRERFFLLAVAEDTHSSARGERWLAASGQAESRRARTHTGGRGGALIAHADRGGVRKQSEPIGWSRGTAVAERDRADAADADGAGLEGCKPARGFDLPARSFVADADSGGLSRISQRDGEPQEREADDRDDRENAGGRVLDWAGYTPAIRRWESVLGRPAPVPTVVGARGGRVLNPALPEWMMGLPKGWITGVPGLSRTQQLKLAGNGVVKQQAVAAYRYLLEVLERDARAAA